MNAPPLIAVVLRELDDSRVTGWPVPAVGLQRNYLEALERAGATPVLLAAQRPDTAAGVLSHFDGLVLPGGDDIDPSHYASSRHPTVYGTNLALDDFELAMAVAAQQASMPTLAICRGAQLLNIVLGGALHQDVAGLATPGEHGIPGRKPLPSLHDISVVADSRLATIVGTTTTGICHHHQAIDVLGRGLRVVACAADGIVEAVESDDWPDLIAVQWHPEETADRDAKQQALFDALVEASLRRRD